MPVASRDEVRRALAPAHWPAEKLAVVGLAALFLCVVAAWWSRPAATQLGAADCRALAAIKPVAEGSGLRIKGVAPASVAIGGEVCVIVEGVATTSSDKLVDLAVYFNGSRAPFTVKAKSIPGPQPLLVALEVPEDATAKDADFWRGLVSEVGWASVGSWGRKSVVVGLSPVAGTMPDAISSEAPVPNAEATTDAAKAPTDAETALTSEEKALVAKLAPGGTFELYVYSTLPFVFGLMALGLLAAATAGFAARTPLLRDNDLTVGDVVPGLCQAARTEVQARTVALAAADAALAAQPADDKLREARDKALGALNDSSRTLDRLRASLLRVHPDLRKTEDDLATAIAREDAARADKAKADAADATAITELARLRVDAVTAGSADQVAVIDTLLAPTAKTLQDACADWAKADTTTAAAKRNICEALAFQAADAEVTAAAGSNDQPRIGRAGSIRAAAATRLDALLAAARLEVAEDGRKRCLDAAAPLAPRAIGSYSLGRTQMAFWLFLVVAGYLYIAMSLRQTTGIVTAEVLTLLGITSATGLGAVLVNPASAARSTTQGYLTDVLQVGNSPQLQRIQALVWTLILGGIFIWATVGEYKFPKLDPTLLMLTGLVSGFYLGFKPQEAAR